MRPKIKDNLRRIKQETLALIEKEKEQYGQDWKERFRNPDTGELPGGMIQDSKVNRLKLLANRK